MSTYAFDLYGTLLDVDSAVRRLVPSGGELSRIWRTKQLEYSWTRTLMRRYADFDTLTAEALDYALAATGNDAGLRPRLLEAYRRLEPFSEVGESLRRLRSRGVRIAVVSNGTHPMLAEALASARLDVLVDEVVSVDELGAYKPAPEVYLHAAERLEVAAGELRFHSSNPWDVAGARAAGLEAVWINRRGGPDEYALRGSVLELRCVKRV
jgi:2-haloacid dehalogenase